MVHPSRPGAEPAWESLTDDLLNEVLPEVARHVVRRRFGESSICRGVEVGQGSEAAIIFHVEHAIALQQHLPRLPQRPKRNQLLRPDDAPILCFLGGAGVSTTAGLGSRATKLALRPRIQDGPALVSLTLRLVLRLRPR